MKSLAIPARRAARGPLRRAAPQRIGRALRCAALPLLLAMHFLAHAQPEGAASPAPSAQTVVATPPASATPGPATSAPSQGPGATTHPVDGPSFAPMGLALLVVLGLMGAVLWVLRRAGFAPRSANGHLLRLVSQLPLGPRERIVIVEAGDRWLLLGVGTAGISRLASLPKGESPSAPAAVASFGTLLERLRKGSAQ